MEITTLAEFSAYKTLLQNTTMALLEIGRERRAPRLKRSTMENWIEMMDLIRKTPRFPEGIEKFRPNVLAAYHLSQEMIQRLARDNEQDQFTLFRQILDLFEKCPKNLRSNLDTPSESNGNSHPVNVRLGSESYAEPEDHPFTEKCHWIKKELEEFLAKQHRRLLDCPISELTHSLQLLFETCPFAKGLIRSVKNFEAPSWKAGISDEHPCDHIKESSPIRIVAYVLEHVFIETQRAGRKLTIEELQNKVVSAGLYFGEKYHPYFMWGSSFTLSQVIDCKKEEMLAWYLTDRIAKCWQFKNYNESNAAHKSNQESVALIRQDYGTIYQFILKHKDKLSEPNFYKECAGFLHSLRVKRGFGKVDIFEWLLGLKGLVNIYDICHKQSLKREREKKKEKEMQSKAPWITILVVGDSGSAGLRVLQEEEGWVRGTEKTLQAKYPVRIVNCSIAGFETSDGVRALASYLKFFNVDIVLCPLGGNDARVQKSVYTISKNMVKFVQICKEHGIEANRVFWGMGIPKTEMFKACQGYVNSFKEMLKKFSEETGVKTAYLPDRILHARYVHEDQLHFTAEIQSEIAKHVVKEIEPMVEEALKEKMKPVTSAILPHFHAQQGSQTPTLKSEICPQPLPDQTLLNRSQPQQCHLTMMRTQQL